MQAIKSSLQPSTCNFSCSRAEDLPSSLREVRLPEAELGLRREMGFPKIRVSILRVLKIRTIVFGGLYWGPLFMGTTTLLSLHEPTRQGRVCVKVQPHLCPLHR